MFYIDDYNSKTITNSPPKKADKEALVKVKTELDNKQLAAFWYIAGVTIASNYDEVSELLLKYGYDVTNEEDAASAIADMLGTPKWTKFLVEFGEIIEETVDESVLNNLKEGNDESGWVEALIQGIGAVGSSSLGLAKSAKDKKAAEASAKAQMFYGITNVLAEKEKLKAEKERTLQNQKKGSTWIIVGVVVVVIAIVGFVIYKKMKSKAQAE
jgi:hypothetical protein